MNFGADFGQFFESAHKCDIGLPKLSPRANTDGFNQSSMLIGMLGRQKN